MSEEIAVEEVRRWCQEPGRDDPLLLDCRTHAEHAWASIDGSVLIPMDELGDRLDELDGWRDRPIVVYCHHGRRSLIVTRALRRAGFADVRSMAGGIEAWSQRIDPDVPRY